MKRLLIPAAVLLTVAWSCTVNPPLPPDDDAGTRTDAGRPDSGRPDSGFDAGPSPDFCGAGSATCDAGSECLIQQLEDGGRGRRCILGDCAVVAQDCDGGMKCDYRDGGRTCVTDGTLAEGAGCFGNGNACIKGTVCTSLPVSDGGLEAKCTKYCAGDSNCTAPQLCLLTLVLPDSTERPQVCADPPPVCDLLTQTCTPANEGCYPNGGAGACFLSGTVAVGAGCTYSNDCGRGATCVNTTGGSTCRTMCAHPSGTPGCDDGGTCTRLAGTTGVGVCL
jgi:hypothetical protein